MSSTEMNETKMQEVVPEEVAGTTSSIKDETTNTLEKPLTIDETKPKSLRTLALIKPDAMQANNKDAIINKIKENNFIISQEQKIQLTKEKAGLFYAEHVGKPFYENLTTWMSSAPIYAMVLEKQDAVQSWRELMGLTNAIKAREEQPNSIRALFGTDGSQNATHGSDSLASAEREIELIFGKPTESLLEVKEVQPLTKEVESDEVCKPDAADNNTDETSVDKEVEQVKVADPIPAIATTNAAVSNIAGDVVSSSNTNNTTEDKPAEIPTTANEAKNNTDDDNTTHNTLSTADKDEESIVTTLAEPILIAPTSTNDVSSVLEPVENNNASKVTAENDEAEKPNVREGSSAEEDAVFTNEKQTSTQEQQQQDPLVKEHFSEEDFIVSSNSKNSPVEEDEELETIPINTADKDEDEKEAAVEKKEIETADKNVAEKIAPVAESETKVEETKIDAKVDVADEEPKIDVSDKEPKVDVAVEEPNVDKVPQETKSVEESISVVANPADEKPKTVEESNPPVAEEPNAVTESAPVVIEEKKSSGNDADQKSREVVENAKDEKKEEVHVSADIKKEELKDVKATEGKNVVEVKEEKAADKAKEPKKVKKSVGALVAAFETSKVVKPPVAVTTNTTKPATDAVTVDKHVDVKDLTAGSEQKDAKLEEETRKVEINMQKSEPVVSEPAADTPITKEEIPAPSQEPVIEKDEIKTTENNTVEKGSTVEDVKEIKDDAVVDNDNQPHHTIPTSETTGDADNVPTSSVAEDKEDVSRTTEELNDTTEEDKATKEDDVVEVNETNNKQDLKVEQKDPEYIPEKSKDEADINNDVNAKENTLEEISSNDDQSSYNEKEENKKNNATEEHDITSTSTSTTNTSGDDHAITTEEEEEIKSEDHQSENSSVTNSNTTNSSSNEKNKEVIGETVNKEKPSNKVSSVNNRKELKPRAPINKQPTSRSGIDGDKKKGGVTTTTARRTLTKPTGLKDSTKTTVKKTTGKEPVTTATGDKPITKPVRVPRVALLTKKAATPSPATEAEEKPKKATSTRSLVSRLTAPTAASARRKDITAGTPASSSGATGGGNSVRKSDPTHKKVNTSSTTSPPSTTATKKTIKKAPMTSSRVSATHTKPTTTTATGTGVRRTTPPSSTATSKKTSEATPVIKQQRNATSVNNKTGTRASGLPKTTKKEVPTAGRKKTSATPRKKPVTAAASGSSTTSASVIKEGVSTTTTTTSTSEQSHHEEEEEEQTGDEKIETPIQADVIEEDQKVESDNVHKGEDVVQDEEITHTNKEEIEHKDELLNEDHTIHEEQVTPAKVEEEVVLEVEPTITKEEELVSVVISEDTTQSSHDAEVAAITVPATTIKPQMASLRSRFENLNNNNNQFTTSKSKELRSKSPNRISDMINRFS